MERNEGSERAHRVPGQTAAVEARERIPRSRHLLLRRGPRGRRAGLRLKAGGFGTLRRSEVGTSHGRKHFISAVNYFCSEFEHKGSGGEKNRNKLK